MMEAIATWLVSLAHRAFPIALVAGMISYWVADHLPPELGELAPAPVVKLVALICVVVGLSGSIVLTAPAAFRYLSTWLGQIRHQLRFAMLSVSAKLILAAFAELGIPRLTVPSGRTDVDELLAGRYVYIVKSTGGSFLITPHLSTNLLINRQRKRLRRLAAENASQFERLLSDIKSTTEEWRSSWML
ncbi:MAG: hypothetical protein WCY11_10380 [Novosphingobium sp.]